MWAKAITGSHGTVEQGYLSSLGCFDGEMAREGMLEGSGTFVHSRAVWTGSPAVTVAGTQELGSGFVYSYLYSV